MAISIAFTLSFYFDCSFSGWEYRSANDEADNIGLINKKNSITG
ncbi:hypothetical protein [Sphaerospermopsis sp. FACHB-1094]|nr:hypothetical protein [Sphaerospermopsis sp. FACHB-1094]